MADPPPGRDDYSAADKAAAQASDPERFKRLQRQPVPAAAVEAVAEWFAGLRDGSVGDSDRAYAGSVLTAALETGTLVAAPQDEQELRAAATELLALKDGPRDADYEKRKPEAWERLRQALGLLPEPQPCPNCHGTGFHVPDPPDEVGNQREECPDCGGVGLLPEQEEARDADGALVAAPGTPSPEQEATCKCIEENDAAVATLAAQDCPKHGREEANG